MIDNAHEVPCTAIAGNDNKETRSKRDTIYDKESDDEKDSFEVITIMTYGKRFGSIDNQNVKRYGIVGVLPTPRVAEKERQA